jgi:hypothetical protein
MASRPPLRFAVITEGDSLPAAYQKALEALKERADSVCVALIIGPPRPGAPRCLESLFPPAPSLRPAPLPASLKELPRISPGDVNAIVSLQADFLLCCASPDVIGHPLLNCAAHGVWAWFYGERPVSCDGPPGFRELYHRVHAISVTLERLGPDRWILRRGTVNTDFTSLENTLEQAALATADLPALVARELRMGGAMRPLLPPTSPFPSPPLAINLRRMLIGAARMRLEWAIHQVRSIFQSEMWNVGLVKAPIQSFLCPSHRPQIDWLPRFRQRNFIADPFAIESDNGLEVLVEEFDYERYQGYIAAIPYHPGQPVSVPGRILIDEGIHMSYPFPIRHGGQLFCIPECQRSCHVALYRHDRENGRWIRHQTLIEGFRALDSSVIRYNDAWYLFCTCQDDFPECKLYIWHAESLFGPWQPHVLNPVKCDVRGSRPAGTFFEKDGHLYRPAQNSSRSYGGSLTINRILKLSATEFEEEVAAQLFPSQKDYWRDGLHTLSSAGPDMCLVDGKRMVFTPALAGRRLRHKAARAGSILFSGRYSLHA